MECNSILSSIHAMPLVEGPIPITAESYPFCDMMHSRVPLDVTKYDYIEEEYYIYSVKIPEHFLSIFQGKQLVLTKGFGRKNHSIILNIFLEPEWENFEKRLNALPVSSDLTARRIAYFFQGSAQDSEP